MLSPFDAINSELAEVVGTDEAEDDSDAMCSDVPSGTIATGQVKWYDADKKYGFIHPLTGGRDIFVHVADICPQIIVNTHHKRSTFPNYAKLFTGEYVSYQLAVPDVKKGRPKAVNVTGLYDANGRPGPLLCDYGQMNFVTYNRRQFEILRNIS